MSADSFWKNDAKGEIRQVSAVLLMTAVTVRRKWKLKTAVRRKTATMWNTCVLNCWKTETAHALYTMMASSCIRKKEEKTSRQATIWEQGSRRSAENRKRITFNKINSLARHSLQEGTEQSITAIRSYGIGGVFDSEGNLAIQFNINIGGGFIGGGSGYSLMFTEAPLYTDLQGWGA